MTRACRSTASRRGLASELPGVPGLQIIGRLQDHQLKAVNCEFQRVARHGLAPFEVGPGWRFEPRTPRMRGVEGSEMAECSQHEDHRHEIERDQDSELQRGLHQMPPLDLANRW
jgi:hypothetical protein